MPRFKDIRSYGVLFLIYFGFSILLTYPLVFKMNSAVYGPFYNTDVRGTIWSLWWLRYSALHHIDYNNCFFLGAPFWVNFGFMPILGINFLFSRLMVVLAGYIVSVNLLTLFGFALTGLFGYLLAYSLIKNKTAAFISGFIFAFCPYHLNKVMEFTYVFLGTWFVLYVYSLFRIKEQSGLWPIMLAAFSFTMTVVFCAYYGFFAFVFTAGLLIFCFLYQWRNKLVDLRTAQKRRELLARARKSLRFVKSIAVVLVLFILLNAQSLWGILSRMFFSHADTASGASVSFARPLDYLIAQSARPLSYLLPASTHPVFGSFTEKMFGSIFYGRGFREQTLYLGAIPLILAFTAFRQWKRKRANPKIYPDYHASGENFFIGFFIFMGWFAFLCSLPPFLDIGIFKIYFPSYYFYKILPMFRAYARFGMVVMLCVAVLAGYGLRYIFGNIKSKNIRFLFTSIVFLAILFEFTNVPPSRVTDILKIPPVYAWLKDQTGDFIIAEYPMAAVSSGEAWEKYDYLYYQTIHQKRMVNGAMQGTKAFEIRRKISKIDDPQTIAILKEMGVEYVIFHSDQYKGGYKEDVDVIGEVPNLSALSGLRLIKSFDSVSVYEIVR